MSEIIFLNSKKEKLSENSNIPVIPSYDFLYKKLQSKNPPKHILISLDQIHFINQCKAEFPFVSIICLIPKSINYDLAKLISEGIDYPLVYSDYQDLNSKLLYYLKLNVKVSSCNNDSKFQLDSRLNCVVLNGKSIHLSQKEFHLLEFMAMHQDQLISKEKLLEAVWGYSTYAYTKTIDVHIAKLRNKLFTKTQYNYITTVHSKGYIFSCPVR